MCLSRRVVIQLMELSAVENNAISSTCDVDRQVIRLFRNVFRQRLQKDWTFPEKRKIQDLVRLNENSIRNAYNFRFACNNKVVDNTKIYRSAVQYLLEDFPAETIQLRKAVKWNDLLTMHRCSTAWSYDFYNMGWNDPKNQQKIDNSMLPNEHEWWLLWTQYRGTEIVLVDDDDFEEKLEVSNQKKMKSQTKQKQKKKE